MPSRSLTDPSARVMRRPVYHASARSGDRPASGAQPCDRRFRWDLRRLGPAVLLDRLALIGPGRAVDDRVPSLGNGQSRALDQAGHGLDGHPNPVAPELRDDLLARRPILDQGFRASDHFGDPQLCDHGVRVDACR